VARNKEQYQEVCSRIYQVSTEQSTTHEKDRRTLFIGKTERTIAGN